MYLCVHNMRACMYIYIHVLMCVHIAIVHKSCHLSPKYFSMDLLFKDILFHSHSKEYHMWDTEH